MSGKTDQNQSHETYSPPPNIWRLLFVPNKKVWLFQCRDMHAHPFCRAFESRGRFMQPKPPLTSEEQVSRPEAYAQHVMEEEVGDDETWTTSISRTWIVRGGRLWSTLASSFSSTPIARTTIMGPRAGINPRSTLTEPWKRGRRG